MNSSMDTDKKKVLFAEDNESITKIITYILQKDGYDIIHYPTGEGVVESAKSNKPDLILLDLMMPIKNGLMILREIKADPETKDIPVIFLSANNSDIYIKEGLDMGAADYILKPFSFDDLSLRIKKQLKII
jgi:two-component system, OmpR family, alkaline phosphatase synthesis response regulator PhoP